MLLAVVGAALSIAACSEKREATDHYGIAVTKCSNGQTSVTISLKEPVPGRAKSITFYGQCMRKQDFAGNWCESFFTEFFVPDTQPSFRIYSDEGYLRTKHDPKLCGPVPNNGFTLVRGKSETCIMDAEKQMRPFAIVGLSWETMNRIAEAEKRIKTWQDFEPRLNILFSYPVAEWIAKHAPSRTP